MKFLSHSMTAPLHSGKFILVAICWQFIGFTAFAARVAIILPDENLESTLTAELGKRSGIEIVERTALSSLAREAALAGNLKGLAGAEVVAIGEKLPAGGFAVRISDPASGAVLQTVQSPPGLDIPLTAEWLARRLAPWLSKTPAKVEQRFSLIGLRFDIDSAANRQTERSLNLALAAALQALPEAVVLERWRLNDLLFEKELTGHGDESFWSAAQVLDGALSGKDGKLRASLRMRSNGKETLLEAEGPASDLPGLATKLAALALKTESVAPPLGDQEAAAYVHETNWLLKHGLKREATQAIETAIALGDKSRASEALRLRCYAEAAYPQNLDPNLYLNHSSAYETSDLPPERIAESVAFATTVANLSEAYARKYASMKRERKPVHEHPTIASVRTISPEFSVLRSAHKRGYDRTDPEAVKALREAIKRHLAAVRALPLAHPEDWHNALPTYYRHLIFFAPYWNDTPEETLRFMDQVLAPDFEKECPGGVMLARTNFASLGFVPPAIPVPLTTTEKWANQPPVQFPRLIDWRTPDNPNIDKIWGEYVEKKLKSADPLDQADGLAFLRTSQPTYEALTSLSARHVDFLEKHLGDLHGLRGQAIWLQIQPGLYTACQRPEAEEYRRRVIDAYETLLTGSSALSPGVIGALITCIPQNVRYQPAPEIGERLMKALSQYTETLGTAATDRDRSEIRQARNTLYRQFPALASKPPANALPVTRAWILGAHTPEEWKPLGRLDENSPLWEGGCLWFLDADNRKIWKVDPANFDTEILAPEGRPTAAPREFGFFNGDNLRRPNRRAVFAGGKLYLPEQLGIWVFDPAQGTWRALSLPPSRYTLWMAHGRLFAGFGELRTGWKATEGDGSGMYEINLSDHSTRLVFNSRRRPGVHPLDSTATERPFCVVPGPGGNVIAGLLLPLAFYDIDSGDKVELINSRLLTNVTSGPEGSLFCHTRHASNRLVLQGIQNIDRHGKLETLLWNPAGGGEPPQKPIWNFPQTIPDPAAVPAYIDYRATMRGEDLVLLVYQYGATPGGTGASDLFFFRRGARDAIHIPLAYQLSAADETALKRYHQGSVSFSHPRVDHYGLVSTGPGLAIVGTGMPGFWFIPWSDIEAREKKAR